jgi:hypothetical protein
MLSKLILFAVLAVAAWYGFRYFKFKMDRDARLKARDGEPPAAAPQKPDELVKCPRCGTYVASGAPHECGAKAG